MPVFSCMYVSVSPVFLVLLYILHNPGLNSRFSVELFCPSLSHPEIRVSRPAEMEM